jgi:hypothetical protein
LRDLLLSDLVGEAINGYSIRYLAPVYFQFDTGTPSVDQRWGPSYRRSDQDLRRRRNAGRNVGLSTLEPGTLDGHLEIHVVLDDADAELTA